MGGSAERRARRQQQAAAADAMLIARACNTSKQAATQLCWWWLCPAHATLSAPASAGGRALPQQGAHPPATPQALRRLACAPALPAAAPRARSCSGEGAQVVWRCGGAGGGVLCACELPPHTHTRHTHTHTIPQQRTTRTQRGCPPYLTLQVRHPLLQHLATAGRLCLCLALQLRLCRGQVVGWGGRQAQARGSGEGQGGAGRREGTHSLAQTPPPPAAPPPAAMQPLNPSAHRSCPVVRVQSHGPHHRVPDPGNWFSAACKCISAVAPLPATAAAAATHTLHGAHPPPAGAASAHPLRAPERSTAPRRRPAWHCAPPRSAAGRGDGRGREGGHVYGWRCVCEVSMCEGVCVCAWCMCMRAFGELASALAGGGRVGPEEGGPGRQASRQAGRSERLLLLAHPPAWLPGWRSSPPAWHPAAARARLRHGQEQACGV